MIKLVFLGTPDFVLPVLENLHQNFNIAAIVTQSPKPVSSPVALWAKENGIEVFDASPKDLIQPVKALGAEVGVLAAYGKILPNEFLELFPKGIINIHPSLLPKYRGPSPVESAIASGDKETGYTIIRLAEKMDVGPILYQVKEEIKDDDTKDSLINRLFANAACSLPETIKDYLEGQTTLQEQDESTANYTTLIKKEYGFIPPQYVKAALDGVTLDTEWLIPFIKGFVQKPSPLSIEHIIRALSPWPSAYSEIQQGNKVAKLKLLKAHIENEKLVLDRVQLEGKKSVTWKQFLEGYPEAKFK